MIKLAFAIALAAATAHADFDQLVRAVESQRGLHRIWTPGIGLVRLGVRIVHPDGVHDFELAVFEGETQFDDAQFNAILRTSPDTPIVRVHSNHSGETAIIWARPVGNSRFEMLLMAHDPGDNTVVLRAVVDAERLAREIANPRHAAADLGHP
jgi:hypothetical protein